MIPAVAIVGKSGSGKTCLIEKLIAWFSDRGYRVAAIKHCHHHINADTEGKDTWRFSSAGAVACMISSPSRFTIFKDASINPVAEEALSALGEGYDVIIIEGFKTSKLPKIEVHRSDLGSDMICLPNELIAVVSNVNPLLDIPQFNINDVDAIANFIESNILSAAGQP